MQQHKQKEQQQQQKSQTTGKSAQTTGAAQAEANCTNNKEHQPAAHTTATVAKAAAETAATAAETAAKAAHTTYEKPVSEQIADCKSFIDRAQKRLVKLDAERESEQALLEEGHDTTCAIGGQRRSFRAFATHSPCCSDGSRVWSTFEQSGRRSHNGSPTSQSPLGGFRPQHCETWRTRLPTVPKGMFPGWRMSSPREQDSCVSGHNHPRQC